MVTPPKPKDPDKVKICVDMHQANTAIRVEPDTRLKRVSGMDKALLPSTSIIRVIQVNICARIE